MPLLVILMSNLIARPHVGHMKIAIWEVISKMADHFSRVPSVDETRLYWHAPFGNVNVKYCHKWHVTTAESHHNIVVCFHKLAIDNLRSFANNFCLNSSRLNEACTHQQTGPSYINGSPAVRRKTTSYTNAGVLLITPLGRTESGIWLKIQRFTGIHFKMSSCKCQLFYPRLDVLIHRGLHNMTQGKLHFLGWNYEIWWKLCGIVSKRLILQLIGIGF